MSQSAFASRVPIYASLGCVSLTLCVVLAVAHASPSLRREHTARLIALIAAMDALYTAKYVVGALAWADGWNDLRWSFNMVADDCLSSTLWGQGFGMASITANALLVLDFVLLIRRPLSAPKGAGRMRAYIGVVVLLVVGVIAQDVVLWEPPPASATCWVRPHSLYFESFLGAFLLCAGLSFVYASVMLWRGGAFRSLRMALLRRHGLFVFVFAIVWSWTLFHRVADPNGESEVLNTLDAVNASCQAGVLAAVRLSEAAVRDVVHSTMGWMLRPVGRACRAAAARVCPMRTRARSPSVGVSLAVPLMREDGRTDTHARTHSMHAPAMADYVHDAHVFANTPRASRKSAAFDARVCVHEGEDGVDGVDGVDGEDSVGGEDAHVEPGMIFADNPFRAAAPEGADREMATLTAKLRSELVACLLSGTCQAVSSAGYEGDAPAALLSSASAASMPPPDVLVSPALSRSHVGASKARLRSAGTVLRRMTKIEGAALRRSVSSSLLSASSADVVRGAAINDSTPALRVSRQSVGGFELASYEDALFAGMRSAMHIAPDAVVQRLDPALVHEGKLAVRFSDGASSSFFCRSDDSLLFLKTVTLDEVNTLLALLPRYAEAMNPACLLCRFAGCFSLKLPSFSRVYALLMINVHAIPRPERTLVPGAVVRSVTFDLKGSSVNRSARKRGGDGSLLLDNDFDVEVPLGIRLLRSALPPESGQPPIEGARLMESLVSQLDADVSLLAEHNIMDYSLILVITSLNERWTPTTDVGQLAARVWAVAQAGRASLLPGQSVPPCALMLGTVPAGPSSPRAAANPHDAGAEVVVAVQLGVIDLLQEYDLMKHLENRLKVFSLAVTPGRARSRPSHVAALPSFESRDAGLSAIDAVRYRQRFLEFVRRAFHE